MCLLLESIKYEKGKLHNLHYHEDRMEYAVLKVFGIKKRFQLNRLIEVPHKLSDELHKCRIVYNTDIKEISFSPYVRKKINAIKLIIDETISYEHKYANRDQINAHCKNLRSGEEVIFVKKGLLRDASFSNIALFTGEEWHTPTFPLLKGTKRAELLEKGLILSKKIRPEHLKNYKRISFITALNDLDELSMPL